MSRTILMVGISFCEHTRYILCPFERPLEDAPEPVTRSSKSSTPLLSWPPDLSGMRSPRRWVQELYLLGHQQGAEFRGEAFDEIFVGRHTCPMRATVGVIIEFPKMYKLID